MARVRGAAAATAVFALLSPVGALAADRERELLDRHRPLLRYDTAEEYFAQPVSLPPPSAEVLPGDRVYGHVATQAGETWLQYWLFFAYNPQDRGLVRTGRHEGDWELFQLRLSEHGAPDHATFSQHSWAEGCTWRELERARGGRVPVVYVANGSHALYSRPGDHDRPFPDPTDEADGLGRETRPDLTLIDDAEPGWVAYAGRWGATEAGPVPGEAPSPRGPRFHAGDAWERPASFDAELARECGSGAPGRWWAVPALVGAVGLITALGLAVRARRRRS